MTFLIAIAALAMPVVVGYLFSLTEDSRNHKHFQRVTELNG